MSREPRCAEWARAAAVDPVGTAGSSAGFVLLEWPHPWPRDVSEIGDLQPLLAALHGTGLRLQVMRSAEAPGRRRRVVVYRQHHDAEGWFRNAVGVERVVDSPTLVDEAIDLVETNAGDTTRKTDILVCGHGRRDICCGSKGVQLVGRIATDGALGADVRLWRTTHLGGHRFAPTALVLPSATWWAFLDQRRVTEIVQRSVEARDVTDHYRGCSGLASPAAQAVERAVLLEIGWQLLDSDRRAVQLAADRIRFDVRAPNGSKASWEATISEGRRLPVPDCGEPPEKATERATEMIIAALLRVA
jgi:hypothetical protein